MRENMVYNPNFYQLRNYQIETIAKIMSKNKDSVPNGLLFFGDSITEWYDIEKYYHDIKIKYNSGVAGSTSESLIWICDEAVIKYKPKVIVFLVGTNDLGNTNMRSPREIAMNVRNLFDLICRNIKDIRIIHISTLPCNEELAGKAMRSNKNIKILNNEYLEMIKIFDNVTFVDVFEKFIDKQTNNIKDDLSEDGLHLTKHGYDLLTELIKPEILKLI